MLGLVFLGGLFLVDSNEASAASLFRLYNPNTGEHHYTLNGNERNHLATVGWNYEGVAWETPATGTPLQRVFNPNNGGDHHYTINVNEVNMLKGVGWNHEGVAWQSGGSAPVHRLYNPNAKTGTHHYTLDENERDNLTKAGWKYEGIAFYAVGKSTSGNASGIENSPGGKDSLYEMGPWQ